jgi:hypothetical protein
MNIMPKEDIVTYGERIVRTEFNPGQNSIVDRIKSQSAELINTIYDYWVSMNSASQEAITKEDRTEINRLCALAIDEVEKASMYGVKAATTLNKKR